MLLSCFSAVACAAQSYDRLPQYLQAGEKDSQILELLTVDKQENFTNYLVRLFDFIFTPMRAAINFIINIFNK